MPATRNSSIPQRNVMSRTHGSHYDREIDFVATNGGVKEYYQISLSIAEGSTFDREMRSLDSVPDNYPKTILTLDRVIGTPMNDIRTINVIDWLLEKE